MVTATVTGTATVTNSVTDTYTATDEVVETVMNIYTDMEKVTDSAEGMFAGIVMHIDTATDTVTETDMDKNYQRWIWQTTTTEVFDPDDGQTEACMQADRQAQGRNEEI